MSSYPNYQDPSGNITLNNSSYVNPSDTSKSLDIDIWDLFISPEGFEEATQMLSDIRDSMREATDSLKLGIEQSLESNALTVMLPVVAWADYKGDILRHDNPNLFESVSEYSGRASYRLQQLADAAENKTFFYIGRCGTDLAITVSGIVLTIKGATETGGGVALTAASAGTGAPVTVPMAIDGVVSIGLGIGIAVVGGINLFQSIGAAANEYKKERTSAQKNQANDSTDYSYKNGKYEKADYHSGQTTGKKSPAPQDGQFALDNSVPVGENTTRRIGLDSNGEFVVFDETSSGVFHGHVRSWSGSGGNQGLTQAMKNALYEAGYVKSSTGTNFKLTEFAKILIESK